MKKIIGLLSVFCLLCFASARAETPAAMRHEIKGDRQEIKEDKQQIVQDSKEAKNEEEALKRRIKEALDAGDYDTADKLKDQWKVLHDANVEEKIEDKKELRSDVKELKEDIKDARSHGYRAVDRDDNPPGPRGGAGTNWENPPGPKGGPGASPDRRKP